MTPDFMGTLPGWITAASTTTGVVTLIVAYWRRGVSLRRLTNEDEADLRDHYAEELSALRSKLNEQEDHFKGLEKHWREMVEASDRRHEECEVARRGLRLELDAMHEELSGLRAQIRAASTDRVLRMEEECPPAPHARAAAHRVKKINEEGGK